METYPETPVATPPVETEKAHVEVTNRNSNLFGKILKVLEQDEEWVIAEVKVGETYIKHLFVKGETTSVVAPTVIEPVK